MTVAPEFSFFVFKSLQKKNAFVDLFMYKTQPEEQKGSWQSKAPVQASEAAKEEKKERNMRKE